MKASELISKTIEELKKELDEACKSLFAYRLQINTQQTSNTAKQKILKRDIARLKTFIQMKKKVK